VERDQRKSANTLTGAMGVWNWLDWVLAAVIVVSVLTAMKKGFVAELVSLATVVVGLIVAAFKYRQVAVYFEDITKSHEVALAAAFLALFVGILILGALISALAQKLIKTAGIHWFDRFMGGVFGLIRGVLVDSVLLMVLVAFAIKPGSVQKAILAPYVTTGARVIALAMPNELKAQFRAGFEQFRQALALSGKAAAKN
jgi:membrane protein required for colicin V production